MRIGLLIADFEMRYSTTFKHSAREKYKVDFATSNIGDVKNNLLKLKSVIESGIYDHVPIRGYDPPIEDVDCIITLLEQILEKYREIFETKVIPSGTKLYQMLE